MVSRQSSHENYDSCSTAYFGTLAEARHYFKMIVKDDNDKIATRLARLTAGVLSVAQTDDVYEVRCIHNGYLIIKIDKITTDLWPIKAVDNKMRRLTRVSHITPKHLIDLTKERRKSHDIR